MHQHHGQLPLPTLDAETLRAANEDFVRALDAFHGRAEEVEIMCECPSGDCVDMIRIPRCEYDRVRSDAAWFAVRAGHLDEDLHAPVHEHETHWVVQQRER